jgi:hypothetical protein
MSEPVFINPAPYGNFKYKHSKSVELFSSPDTKIVSPYDGVVIYDYTPMCEDSIKIMHTFDEKVIYSVFCGIKRPYVKYNDEVKQGSTIGKFLDDKVKYYIVDEDDEKQEIPTFFTKKVKDDKKKEKDDEPEDEKETKITTSPKNDETPNPFMDLFLSPLYVAKHVGKEVKKDVKNLFSKKKDKKDDEDTKKDIEGEENKLTEEIERIKKLML